jgi:aryl sulfotransferase
MPQGGSRIYRSGLTDSTRWDGFPLRSGDIVISVPPKCGTTWMQMICALLVFQDAEFPAPLTTLSPWLDMRLRPVEEVRQSLARQSHRRFIKTHTPLDGLPQAPGVSYVVVGRDPLDVAVSLDHHRDNLDRQVIDRLTARSSDLGESRGHTGAMFEHGPSLQRDRLLAWIQDDRPPIENLHSLRGLVWHLVGAWASREDGAVTVVHHADLSRDLEGEMRRLAERLDITVAPGRWPSLVDAAGFGRMRARAAELVPDERLGLLVDNRAFFRSGRSGQWHGVLTEADLDTYERRLSSLSSPDLRDWLR